LSLATVVLAIGALLVIMWSRRRSASRSP
jgi:hypothetical protein